MLFKVLTNLYINSEVVALGFLKIKCIQSRNLPRVGINCESISLAKSKVSVKCSSNVKYMTLDNFLNCFLLKGFSS